MTTVIIDEFCHKFDDITKKPEKFVSAPTKLIDNVKKLIKETYDFTKKEETISIVNTLPELIIDNFDIEQIWQQIELQNENTLSEYLSSVSRLVAFKEKLWFTSNDDDKSEQENDDLSEKITDDESDSSEEIKDESISDEENDEQHGDDEQNTDESEDENIEMDNLSENETDKEIKKPKQKRNKSVVDDEFFKLDEMEQFLKNEEQKPDKKHSDNDDDDDEESVDLFENNPNMEDADESDEENSDAEMNPKYDDFFGESKTTNKKRKKESEKESEDDDDEKMRNKKSKVHFENEPDNEDENKNIKSTLEEREDRLKRKIEEIEENAIEEKPWQLKGEVTADKRPQNSLLEEIVDFDLTVRPAPVITEETTMRLEDVIKQRIKDKAWDDVERKIKEIETPFEYKKKLILDQEKSKQSLAQIYEDEFVKQQEALDPNVSDKPDEEPKEHTEIKTLMKKLFNKLDALSNFHFTPKSVVPELRIVSNLPAINMEEVAPVATSDAALLAPEEVKNKSKGDEIGQAERTDTDKKRERRQKKQKQREHAKEKKQKEKIIEKLRPGLGNKYSKQKAAKLLEKVTKDRNVEKMDESAGNKGLKSSTAFFSQLQDEVKSHIKSKAVSKNKKSKQTFNARKLKL